MSTPSWLPVMLSGALLSASLIIAIGAQNAFVLQQGVRREHVLPVVALCALMDLLLMAAGVAGIAATLGEHPRWLDALAWGGAAFLTWYGWGAARRALRPQALTADAAVASRPLGRVLAHTLAVTLLNPHVYLDTVLLVGAVGSQQPAALRPAFVAGAGLASAAWFFSLGYAAQRLAPVLRRPAAWRVVDAGIALTMFALAGVLLRELARRHGV